MIIMARALGGKWRPSNSSWLYEIEMMRKIQLTIWDDEKTAGDDEASIYYGKLRMDFWEHAKLYNLFGIV